MDDRFTEVHRLFTRVDETDFSLVVPGTAGVEPDDDDNVAPPLLGRPAEVDDNGSDDKDDDKNKERIPVKDIEEDDEELMEEALRVGRGHRVQPLTNH